MDAFSKLRKSAGREEQKRQMINKAIDLLHKLANKRMDYADARSEISKVVSEYYVIDDAEGIRSTDKINLEVMINNAFDVIEGVKEEKLNLYQAIMLMNKVMAHGEVKLESKEERKEKPIPVAKAETRENPVTVEKEDVKVQEIVEEKVVQQKEMKKAPQTKILSQEEETFSVLMNNVIENKQRLHDSIEELNDVLRAHGFTLNTLEPK